MPRGGGDKGDAAHVTQRNHEDHGQGTEGQAFHHPIPSGENGKDNMPRGAHGEAQAAVVCRVQGPGGPETAG